MSGAEWALQVGLRDALSADAGVKAWLGDPPRIYDEAPDDPIFPYLTFGRSESRVLDGDDAPATEQIIHLHYWSRYGGRREAKEGLAAVRAAVDGAAPTLDGHRLCALRPTYTDVFRAGDGRTVHGVVRLRALTEPEI